ncbi:MULTISPECIES: nucleoside-diphosphate sugar epimerase/dehydratase [Arthrobacter]|uniref:Polysaccharide biosynthesis protein n=1 Tax=Arthrobacter jinronghuae TaxID=2964609 RepID=A0ABT1NSQ2_9MICC|nr:MULTISPECIES: nucleoside-diphosphate sugar epimerase/dehydratase [Arthrobacter]MCQ1949586.1 polysaccharide biosynthesis protein [Arthrobacter jinronghuae]MCQ1952906.1 polysaccharide biosynthesis protein [Arthrobacter sp. zg-Y238]MCQ1954973.1 polysaccharide biosynthesis protein [Arthrobacter jinronghuae]UWX77648.1 polysaccharide biosynthesis protein [Arthrobacter jinronghuae]
MRQKPTDNSRVPREEKPVLWLWSQYMLDSLAWIVSIGLALVLRYELTVEQINPGGLAVFCGVAVLTQLIVGYSFALYRGRYSFGSFHEMRLLAVVTLIVSAILVLASALFGLVIDIPRSTGMIAFPFACLFMAAIRYLKRMYVESKARPGEEAQRALVYGAGFLGGSLVSRMMKDPESPYYPVGLVDDDPAKKHLRLATVPVLGKLVDLPELVQRTRATVLVVAIADVEAKQVREISDLAEGLDLRVLVLPPLKDMLSKGDGAGLGDFRDVAVEDLIGRRPVDIHVDEVAGYLSGKKVLVTGAGGSIGSELCRQITAFNPGELIMVDRDETGLQLTQLSITGRGLLDGPDTVLADIRDPEALDRIFRERRPDVVFHAAALKHVSLLEQYPQEAWKTNIIGTANVLAAARKANVRHFVNISTDKAANPTTVLGHSKRVAEKLTAWMARATGEQYVSVRFGNVIGSRGSMLPLFSEQIRQGGPVTVTDPEVTRFFMTIPEACQLVIQAGAIGRGGEVMILDMGEPVKILDVARRMIAMSGKDIEIVFTGLRQGEKLHEILVGTGEEDSRPLHPKISHAAVAVLDPDELDLADWLRRCGIEPGSVPTDGAATDAGEIVRIPGARHPGAPGDAANESGEPYSERRTG